MKSPRRVLFAPFGSEGDVSPLIWLGERMAERGFCPVFLLSPHYAHLAEQRGFEWHAVGTEEDYQRLAADPDLWHPNVGPWRVARAMHESLGVYRRVFRQAGGAFDLAVTSTFGFAVSSLAERGGIPRLMLHLQPMCVRSVGDMFVPGARGGWVPRAPKVLLRMMFAVMDAVLDRTMLPPVNRFRAKLGLRSWRNLYADGMMGAEAAALLVPSWYAPPQPDWPAVLREFDFPLPRSAPKPLDGNLAAWLDAGEAPVLWTHGSANVHLREAQKLAVEVTRRVGGRALLVGQVAPDFPLPAEVLHVAYVAFEDVFSRCRAVVHHGGIGTTSKCFAAGVPQVILPLAHDQFDNAARVSRLKAGLRGVSRPARLAAVLREVCESGEIREGVERCRRLAADSSAERLAEWAVELCG